MDEIDQSMTVENPGFPRLGGGANPNGRGGAKVLFGLFSRNLHENEKH